MTNPKRIEPLRRDDVRLPVLLASRRFYKRRPRSLQVPVLRHRRRTRLRRIRVGRHAYPEPRSRFRQGFHDHLGQLRHARQPFHIGRDRQRPRFDRGDESGVELAALEHRAAVPVESERERRHAFSSADSGDRCGKYHGVWRAGAQEQLRARRCLYVGGGQGGAV